MTKTIAPLKTNISNRKTLVQARKHSLKRCFDLCFSLVALTILSPLFITIAIAIRITSGGKAIYTQPRLGLQGKIFTCYKFRTMYPDADAKLAAILSSNPRYKKEWLNTQKLKNDPRILPFGHWLRKTSLDELPQFWNVLKGDLSIVGPRPYMIFQKRELGPLAEKILSIKPGLTGLWQTSGRSSTTFQKRMALDCAYVDQSTFLYDLFLILKTIPQLIFQKNAY